MFNKTDIVPKSSDTMTFYEAAFAIIKSDLCDIANTYLNIAYRVYEIDTRIRKDGRKCKYKNIVDACEKELGFKKSTTYNMLKVVKTYGVDDKGKISYRQLTTYTKYSYSQLVEMLSLGSEQRAAITPDTPVSAIRMLKKSNEKDKPESFQTSGKTSKPSERSETFQTSGKSSAEHGYKFFHEDGDLFCEFDPDFVKLVDDLDRVIEDFYYDLGGLVSPNLFFGHDKFRKYSPDEIEILFESFMSIYRQAFDRFYEQLDLKKKSAV